MNVTMPETVADRGTPPDGLNPPTHGNADGGTASARTSQYISFRIGREEYAIDIMCVREIKGWTDVTPLPNQPDYMRGVLNLRGAIVPIFDVACRFGGAATEATKTHVVIIVAVDDRIMGLLVDAVSDILDIPDADVRPAPSIEDRSDNDFVAGLVSMENGLIAILKLELLLSVDLPSMAGNGPLPDQTSFSSPDPETEK